MTLQKTTPSFHGLGRDTDGSRPIIGGRGREPGPAVETPEQLREDA
jgi:hypothetical protein